MNETSIISDLLIKLINEVEQLKQSIEKNVQAPQFVEEPPAEKLAVTIKEAAGLLGVSLPTVYELARRDDFPSMRFGESKYLISVKGLRDWIEEQTAGVKRGG